MRSHSSNRLIFKISRFSSGYLNLEDFGFFSSWSSISRNLIPLSRSATGQFGFKCSNTICIWFEELEWLPKGYNHHSGCCLLRSGNILYSTHEKFVMDLVLDSQKSALKAGLVESIRKLIPPSFLRAMSRMDCEGIHLIQWMGSNAMREKWAVNIYRRR